MHGRGSSFALAASLLAAVLGLALLFGPVDEPAEGFRWSVREATADDVAPLHIDTVRGHVWLEDPLGTPTAGHAGVGIGVRLVLSVEGVPRQAEVEVGLIGPGGSLGRSTSHWSTAVRGGETFRRTSTLTESGIYTLRIDPSTGPVRWSAVVTGEGSVRTPAWRAPAPWSIATGALVFVAGIACLIWSQRGRMRAAWVAALVGTGALVTAGIVSILSDTRVVSLPAWACLAGAAAMGILATEIRAAGPIMPAGVRSLAEHRLGWVRNQRSGALRGSRLGVVAAASVLAIALGTTWRSGTAYERGQFDLENWRGNARGPGRIVVGMDTRGAPLRVRGADEMGGWAGRVGPDFDVEWFFTSGEAGTAYRLLDPSGDVVWRDTAGPGQRTEWGLVLDEAGVWRLVIETEQVRGLFGGLYGTYPLPQPIWGTALGRIQLAWFALAGLALVAAPIRRAGAAIAGLAVLPLGLGAPYGVLSGWFEAPYGAGVTVALVLAVAGVAGVVTGWLRHRRAPRDAMVVGGLILGAVALGIALLTFGRVLEGIGYGAGTLMSREEYATAGSVFVFACATTGLWLSGLLIGFGTAPWRAGSPQPLPPSRSMGPRLTEDVRG